MKLLQICKRFAVLFAVCVILATVSGCKGKAKSPTLAQNTDSVSANEASDGGLSEITTNFGTLFIPQKHKKLMKITVENEKSYSTVKFSAKGDGKLYDLFKINIGKEDGQIAGTLTDKNGTSHDVFVTVYDLGDISGLSEDKQDMLYSMQESVNTVIENLK